MLPTNCDVSDDVCCVDVWGIAEHLRSNVLTAVNACIDDECELLLSYVTMGQGDDGVVNSLAVAFMGTSFSPGSQQSGAKLSIMPLVRARFDVRIRENGWPIVNTEGGVVNAPDPERQHALARHAFAHGEAMYRKLLAMHAAQTLIPTAHKRQKASLSDLFPLPPLGGTIGFYATVTADVAWGGGQ